MPRKFADTPGSGRGTRLAVATVMDATALIQCELPIFFATGEGHTRRIAQRIAEHLRAWGVDSVPIDIGSTAADAVDWSRVRAVAVGASLHNQQYQDMAAAFVRTYRGELNARPSVFFSVSLGTASPKPEYVEGVRRLAEEFPDAAGWHPSTVACFGGALAYLEYGLPRRLMMKAIARTAGWPTDTRRNHDFTDWSAVEALAHRLLRLVQERTRRAA
jgi:menaquinone-dependent protoporphyrinogen oxidase